MNALEWFACAPGFAIPPNYIFLLDQLAVMRCDDRQAAVKMLAGSLKTYGIALDNRVFPIEAKFWRQLHDTHLDIVIATGELQGWKGVPYPTPALILVETQIGAPKGFKYLRDVRDESRRDHGYPQGDEELRGKLAKHALSARYWKWDFERGAYSLGDEVPLSVWKSDAALDTIARGYIIGEMDAPSPMYPCDEIVVRVPREGKRNGREPKHDWHRIRGVALLVERKRRTVKLEEFLAGVREELLRRNIVPPDRSLLLKNLGPWWRGDE